MKSFYAACCFYCAAIGGVEVIHTANVQIDNLAILLKFIVLSISTIVWLALGIEVLRNEKS